MSTTQKDLEESLRKLANSTYSSPQRGFMKEELAVKQTALRMAKELAQLFKNSNSSNAIPTSIDLKEIEDMTKRGHLTLVAEALDNHFLSAIENIVKFSEVEFRYHMTNDVTVSELYNRCMVDLIKATGKKPQFGDILLRMYTQDSAFFKQLNAIVCGFNDPDNTTEEEIALSFLLNLAIHKVSLDKSKRELHQAPDELFRGQTRGLDTILEKYNQVIDLQKNGRLDGIDADELSKINIADIMASKKIMSTTAEKNVATRFATTKDSVIMHIKNPSAIADFCNVANISNFSSEAEFISRLPDDVAMIPVNITKDNNGTHHVEVFCIRSAGIALNHSTRYEQMRESALKLLDHEIQKSKRLVGHHYSKKQDKLLKELFDTIQKINLSNSTDPLREQQFLQKCYKVLGKLYDISSEKQIKKLNKIKGKIDDFAAVYADLSVDHGIINPEEKRAVARENLLLNLEGITKWLKTLPTSDKTILAQASMHFIILQDDNIRRGLLFDDKDSLDKIKLAADSIIKLCENDKQIAHHFIKLEPAMEEISEGVTKIGDLQTQIPTKNFSIAHKAAIQQLKTVQTNTISPIVDNTDKTSRIPKTSRLPTMQEMTEERNSFPEENKENDLETFYQERNTIDEENIRDTFHEEHSKLTKQSTTDSGSTLKNPNKFFDSKESKEEKKKEPTNTLKPPNP